MDKSPDAFRTISEVAADLDLPQHVLRFWETRFSQIKPMKRTGGRRYYRPDDVELVRAIKGLLYGQGYTIKGVQRLLKENGVRALVAAAQNPSAKSLGPRTGPDDAHDPAKNPAQAALPLEQAHEESAAAWPPADGADLTHAGFVAPERLGALVAELAACVRILRAAQAS